MTVHRPIHHTGHSSHHREHGVLVPIRAIWILSIEDGVECTIGLHSGIIQFLAQLPALRKPVQHSACREEAIEILALMVVEAEIHIAKRSIVTNLVCIDETQLIE